MGRKSSRLLTCALLLCAWLFMPATAQQPGTATTVATAKPGAGSDWEQLTATQRTTLAPLAGEWSSFEPERKQKWLQISDSYARMSPDEQARLHQRMSEWAALTPEQRRVARDSFARMRPLAPETRAAVVQKYQQLPEETRKNLTAQAKASKSVLHARPATQHHGPVPTKAQIREGSKQRVPGPSRTFAEPAKPASAAPATESAAMATPASAAAPAPAATLDAGAVGGAPAATPGSVAKP